MGSLKQYSNKNLAQRVAANRQAQKATGQQSALFNQLKELKEKQRDIRPR